MVMRLQLDRYAYLDSPIHRWSPRFKFSFLAVVVVLFAAVQQVWLVPLMVAFALGIYAASQLPPGYLIHRLRYPGVFLLTLIVVLPFFAGETVWLQLGPLSIKAEGVAYMVLVVGRFFSILTVSIVIFSTSPFMTHVRELRSMGVSPILTDTLLLTVRYLYEISDMLSTMQRAMRLRGFAMERFNLRQAGQLAGLMGTMLVRSYEQSERVYTAMRLRGYSAKEIDMNETTAETALHLDAIEFAYPGHKKTLNGVTLEIKDGERVGLIGPNGAGKSSLLLTVCGVHAPSGGSVALYDEPVDVGAFHPTVGLVFQNSNDQLFSATVQDDVAFGPRNMGMDDEMAEKRATEALALTGTEHLAERVPHHLSGG
ncbi:MAG: cobalt ECF transporter T component CbiQ, partial [Chloroflexota bacterium]